MCVILIAQTKRLTDAMIDDAVEANPHGNGFAWIENGAVRFEKGLSVEEAQDLAATVPLPYVFHARIATIGGVRKSLCHPFPLDRRLNPNQLSGRSTKGVLFHNGHWSDWDAFVKPTGEGHWSDSRAMAQVAAEFGAEGITTCVDESQRVVLLTTAGVERFGRGWVEYTSGRWASNQGWLNRRAPLVAGRR